MGRAPRILIEVEWPIHHSYDPFIRFVPPGLGRPRVHWPAKAARRRLDPEMLGQMKHSARDVATRFCAETTERFFEICPESDWETRELFGRAS